ncbi:hypothetical protein [Nocardioides sp.]|uniref:hypothetical protein n=1 Tax=Nocardioides sp. TaxID=35761 RepID=UPI0037851D1A
MASPARSPRAPRALAALAGAGLLVALPAAPSLAADARPGVVTVRTVQVGKPGNPAVGVVPFTDAIYASCADAPTTGPDCVSIGGVDHRYGIAELETTVGQWVTFLNTVDPRGRDAHRLWTRSQGSTAWPGYGQVDRVRHARPGTHYRVAAKAWADKPYGFATFLSAARFVNSLDNGTVLSRSRAHRHGVRYVTYRVRLSPRTERGMYDLRDPAATRSRQSGFVVPSQDEWVKAAYYDPDGGGTLSYWKYPTNPGVFGDGSATAPHPTALDYSTGDVVNRRDQPLAGFRASGQPAPTWCPPAAQLSGGGCSTVNPFGMGASAYAKAFVGSLATVGQARTRSPWGTLDQGGNAVEWTDTITPPPSGRDGGRTWRRLHGGVANAPAYQMWPSAVGLQPQDNAFFARTYPWLGFRVGVVGSLGR